MSCRLCQSGQVGGSLASDNVVSIVTCDTFAEMDKNFTNQFGGAEEENDNIGSIKVYNSELSGGKGKRKTRRPRRKGQQGGSTCGDDQIVNDLPSMYSVNPANIPQQIPGDNMGSVEMSRISQYVFDSVANQTALNNAAFNKVYFPEYISEHVPNLQQSGGKGKSKSKRTQKGGCPFFCLL